MKILFDFDKKTIKLMEPIELVKIYDTFDEYGLDWKEWILIPHIDQREVITPATFPPYHPPFSDQFKITC